MKSQNRHPRHDLTQTWWGSRYVCPVWIHPRKIILTHPRTSFRINECHSSKYDTHKSTTNKRRIEWITWRIFYTNKINQLKQTSLNTLPEPFPQPSTNLQRKKICMSSLDTTHKHFFNAPEVKFQDQQTLIWSILTNRSPINETKLITKTPNKNTWWIINWRNNNNLTVFQ